MANRTYTHAIGAFARSMRGQMVANRHKRGWEAMEPWECYRHAMHEMAELAEALHSGTAQDKVREVADVANFLMMLHEAVAVSQEGKSDAGKPV